MWLLWWRWKLRAIFLGIFKERDHLGDVDVDGCVQVKWLENQLCVDWSHLSQCVRQ